MTRRMADSVTPANLPPGFALYGAYVDGHFKNYAAVEAMYPGKVVGIAVFSTTNDGIVGDCENGDMTPQTAVTWVQLRRKAGVDPTVYCSEAFWQAVKDAFAQAKVLAPHWWIAGYPGSVGEALYPGSVAHQWIDRGPYDESIVADYWPGVDQPPYNPSSEDEMPLYTTNSAGTGFVVATDLSTKIGMPDAADAQALLATGLYHNVKLTDQLINSIPNA